jgi:ribosomal protein S18 acetylase RimI-like enzyme
MFQLNIGSEIAYLKDIEHLQLPELLKWYNNANEFRFATGVDSAISFEALSDKYNKSRICSRDFFAGIYITETNDIIGFLKGQIAAKGDMAWLSSIIIDRKYQRKGYGTLAIDLLIKCLRMKIKAERLFLAVAEDNIGGRMFWGKQNFNEIKRIENCIKLNNKPQNAIIMEKNI